MGCVTENDGLEATAEDSSGGLKTPLLAADGALLASVSAGFPKLNCATPKLLLPFPLPDWLKLKLGPVFGSSLGSSSPWPTRRQEKLPSVSPPPPRASAAGLGAWGSPLRAGAADVSFTGSPDTAGGGVGVGELVLAPSAGEEDLGEKMEEADPKENLGKPPSFTGRHKQKQTHTHVHTHTDTHAQNFSLAKLSFFLLITNQTKE